MGTTARVMATVALVGGLATLTACGSGGSGSWHNADGTVPAAAAAAPAGISVTAPENGAAPC